MADHLDPDRARAAEDVHSGPVFLLLVQVGSHQPVEVVSQVAGDRYGLEEYFRHDHRRPEIQPDTSSQSGHDRAEDAKVDH